MKARDIISCINDIAPEDLQMDWDNSGLQVGDINQKINSVLITLDITKEVIKEALNKKCEMIIAHHPLIFKPLTSLNPQNENDRIIINSIKNNLILYSAHTNLDIVSGGLNDYLAKLMGLNNIKPLKITKKEKYFKLIVFVPPAYFEEVRQTILNNGAGFTGNYSHTSFALEGKGSFKPLPGSDPFSGNINKFTEVEEYKLETIISKSEIKKVKKAILKVHPYEEPVIDIYPLENIKKTQGIGRIGQLQKTILLENYIKEIKEKLNLEKIRISGQNNKNIKTVAICNGSGGDFITEAKNSGADVYITGDVKYHQALKAQQLNLTVIDAGHYNTEVVVKQYLRKKIGNMLNDIKIIISEINTNPWVYH